MIMLSKENLSDYIREHVAARLDFVTRCRVQGAAVVGGGLVSAVLRADVDGRTLYFKQAIPGRLDKIRDLAGDVPEDAFVVWYDGRQVAEIKALRIFEKAVPPGFVPRVLHHDEKNQVMVLSAVCGSDAKVLADVMNEEIHASHAAILGRNIACVANHTYGRFQPLRDATLEKKLKAVKYRYEVGEVWDAVEPRETRERILERIREVVAASSGMNQVLVHGDYHERNIVLCGEDCATVDLEESHWGDPVADIAKLTASYVLRILYFDPVKKDAAEAARSLLEAYFETLNIPESMEDLQRRLRILLAGCLLLRVDGISSRWLPWVHVEEKKERTRGIAVSLVLGKPSWLPEFLETL